MVALIQGLLTGLAFGIVLYKVGASRYSRVMGMLTLRDTKVMKFAFTAIATSSFFYGLAAIFGVAEQWNLVPKVMPFTGSAHLLGGIMFGATMGVVGFCPGTCMAKVGGASGSKKFAGLASVIGLMSGILVYDRVKPSLMDAGIIAKIQKPMTLFGLAGISYGAMALIFAAIMIVIALVVDRLTPEMVYPPAKEKKSFVDKVRGEWTWWASGITGGLLVTLATTQGGYLGFSGGLLALVGWIASSVGHPLSVVPTINEDIMWHAALIVGVIPGGLLARATGIRSMAAAKSTLKKEFDAVALGKSFSGGLFLALGAMIGGGCTTGAFISAWPTLSVGSFAMAGTFFASSMIVSNILYFTKNLDLQKAQVIGDQVYD